MANVRDSDTSLWLHNKLGTSNDSWINGSICSQLNKEVLRNIKECFPDLQTQVKLKLLLSFLHIPRRLVEEVNEIQWIEMALVYGKSTPVHTHAYCGPRAHVHGVHLPLLKQKVRTIFKYSENLLDPITWRTPKHISSPSNISPPGRFRGLVKINISNVSRHFCFCVHISLSPTLVRGFLSRVPRCVHVWVGCCGWPRIHLFVVPFP